MAKYKLIAFGIARDIVGGKETTVEISGNTVGELRNTLLARHPSLTGLNSLLIAVNNVYAEDDWVVSETDEIAMIPPVSGG